MNSKYNMTIRDFFNEIRAKSLPENIYKFTIIL